MAAGGGIPTYVYPEDAARTLGRAMKHVRWRARPAERPADFPDVRRPGGSPPTRRRRGTPPRRSAAGSRSRPRAAGSSTKRESFLVPVLACGAGGTRAELHPDVAVRICPVSAGEAGEMVRSLAIFPLLTGFRGEPPADVAALEELLLQVSAMVDAHREIAELDLNPVIADPSGALAVDARIRLRPAKAPRPWPSTWQ